MKLQPRARAGIALLAAYAVAMQALLLAVIAPAAAVSGGSAGVAALPLCAGAARSWAWPDDGQAGGASQTGQTGHGQDCLDACLTGCCCGVPLMPLPPSLSHYARKPLQTLAAESETQQPVVIRAAKAHRSRAPPAA
jgi:hypothetical protein